MTDLTVLVSPIPLYPETKDFTFRRRSLRPLTPIMVTLEREVDEEADEEASKAQSLVTDMDFINPPTSPQRRTRTPIVDNNLLSPPANTWRARPRHRPTRSQSAPPERRTPPATSQEDRRLEFNILEGDSSSNFAIGRTLKRNSTSTLSRPITRVGELVRPPPPLFRPTTFWRKNRRSGVTGASYSPSSHLIRRSTYIAAGLAFDAPIHDLSALCVESRVGFIVIPSDQLLQ